MTSTVTQSQVLSRSSAKRGGSGPKQDRDVAALVRDQPTAFAGYAFIKSLGTPLSAIFQVAMDIIRFKNGKLMLIAATSCKVPRGILFVDSNDAFDIRGQGHTTLILRGERDDIVDEVNYKALRLVGYTLCMVASRATGGNEYAKAYLEDNGNPLSVTPIDVPADSLDEALLINASLQKSLPLTARQEIMTKIGTVPQSACDMVSKMFNSAPALHDHFVAVLTKQTDVVAFLDGSAEVYGVKPADADARRGYERKGVFNATDAADDTKVIKPLSTMKMLKDAEPAKKAADKTALGQEVLRLT